MWMSGVRFTLPAPALWSEMTFLRSVISLQSYAWSMILRSRRRACFSENRYPARIKSGPGFVGIMLELIRQSTALVARRRVDRSHQGAPVLPGATSPTAEAMRSERIQSEFESPVAHHFCFFARVAQWRRREA